jgi:hypothetical protein
LFTEQCKALSVRKRLLSGTKSISEMRLVGFADLSL